MLVFILLEKFVSLMMYRIDLIGNFDEIIYNLFLVDGV